MERSHPPFLSFRPFSFFFWGKAVVCSSNFKEFSRGCWVKFCADLFFCCLAFRPAIGTQHDAGPF